MFLSFRILKLIAEKVNSPSDGINKRAAVDDTVTPSVPMFVPYSANGTVQVCYA